MAIMKKYALEKQYVQVPNETAKAVEAKSEGSAISLQALGLIVNLWSYDISTWELRKTELYKRFKKNARTSVNKAWDELVEAKFIIEFKYRSGKSWEYVYIYRIEPFSEREIEKIMAECVEEYKVSSTVDFVHLKMDTSKSTANKYKLTKNKLTKKDIKNLVNKGVNNEDDISPENNSIQEQEPNPQELQESHLTDIANEFYAEFALGRWSKKQWVILINKLVDEIIASNVNLKNPKSYIYSCLKSIAYKHDLKYGKAEVKSKSAIGDLFLSWLEDEDE